MAQSQVGKSDRKVDRKKPQPRTTPIVEASQTMNWQAIQPALTRFPRRINSHNSSWKSFGLTLYNSL